MDGLEEELVVRREGAQETQRGTFTHAPTLTPRGCWERGGESGAAVHEAQQSCGLQACEPGQRYPGMRRSSRGTLSAWEGDLEVVSLSSQEGVRNKSGFPVTPLEALIGIDSLFRSLVIDVNRGKETGPAVRMLAEGNRAGFPPSQLEGEGLPLKIKQECLGGTAQYWGACWQCTFYPEYHPKKTM